MLPHKTPRGKAALERLKVFEGCPYPYSNAKKTYVAKALKVMRLKFGRKFCLLGELCKSVGWNKSELVEKLEEKRIEKSKSFYEAKVELEKKVDQICTQSKEIQSIKEQLAQYGF